VSIRTRLLLLLLSTYPRCLGTPQHCQQPLMTSNAKKVPGCQWVVAAASRGAWMSIAPLQVPEPWCSLDPKAAVMRCWGGASTCIPATTVVYCPGCCRFVGRPTRFQDGMQGGPCHAAIAHILVRGRKMALQLITRTDRSGGCKLVYGDAHSHSSLRCRERARQ
jgi:hypothetical protein